MKHFIHLFCLAMMSCFVSVYAELNEQAAEILHFWFGDIKTASDYPKDKVGLWFGGSSVLDHQIKTNYEKLVVAAAEGELDDWKSSPQGRLALIILLDQFPRNIYRNDPKAFAFDFLAQQLALEGIEGRDDLKLLPTERVFFYLPLEHAESLKLQKLSVGKFKEIVLAAPTQLKSTYENYLDYAVRHLKMIARFGRFPYRNEILNRVSTPDEVEFLKGPDSSF
jgi:uncharacterized protein (DUF924 family)